MVTAAGTTPPLRRTGQAERHVAPAASRLSIRRVAFCAFAVRHSFASSHADRWTVTDAGGLARTEECRSWNRRTLGAERLLEAPRAVERRGRELNPRGTEPPLAIFETVKKWAFCRDVCSRSPVRSLESAVGDQSRRLARCLLWTCAPGVSDPFRRRCSARGRRCARCARCEKRAATLPVSGRASLTAWPSHRPVSHRGTRLIRRRRGSSLRPSRCPNSAVHCGRGLAAGPAASTCGCSWTRTWSRGRGTARASSNLSCLPAGRPAASCARFGAPRKARPIARRAPSDRRQQDLSRRS